MFAKDFCKSAAMSSESPEQRFARLVIEAFESQALTTDELVKQAGGPSNTYMTGLRKAAEGKSGFKEPRSDTYGRIERAANWKRGTARKVWRGGEPEPHPEFVPVAPWQKEPELPRRRTFSSGLDGYVERIADRLLDLEERVDYLEQQLQERGGDEGDAGGAPATRKPDSGPDKPSSSGLSALPTAASKTPTTPSVNKRRQRQDAAAEASQDDGDFEPR